MLVKLYHCLFEWFSQLMSRDIGTRRPPVRRPGRPPPAGLINLWSSRVRNMSLRVQNMSSRVQNIMILTGPKYGPHGSKISSLAKSSQPDFRLLAKWRPYHTPWGGTLYAKRRIIHVGPFEATIPLKAHGPIGPMGP